MNESEPSDRTESAALTALLESAGDVIAMMDTEHRYTRFNRAFRDEFERIFGVALRPGDSMPQALAHLPADLAHALAYWDRALAGEDFTVTQQFGDASRGRGWYELRFSPIREANGKISGAVHVVRDVTERTRFEDDLAMVARQQQVLLEAPNVGIVFLVDRKMVWVNRWVEETFGYTRDELIGQTTRLFYPSQAAYEALGASAYPELTETGTFETEMELRRRDGSLLWAKYNGRLIDPTDPSRGTLWVLSDHTGEHRAIAELARLRKHYETLLTISQDGIHVLDEQGNLVEANAAFLRMLGQPPEAVGRLNVRDWDAQIAPNDLEPAVRSLLDVPALFETRHRRKDGTVFDAEVHAGPVELDGRRYLLAASRDISPRKALERERAAMTESLAERVAQAVAELRAKDQLLITQGRQAAMGEMLGNIAHQWRQPLNTLGLVLANLQDASRCGELDARGVDEAVGDANRLIQSMSTTIDDFRGFFQPTKERRAFSALAQIRNAVALIDASVRHAGIGVEIEAASDVTLFGFANEYAQIILNLLSNARQAIEGQQVAQGRIVVRVEQRDGAGCVTVRDNGGGIRPDVLDRIFEPYFSTKEGGTGIGLYMSRQIAEQSLGGRLEARNVEGGAELTLITPLAG